MENFIKRGKNGFSFTKVSSAKKIVNANLFQIRILAYTLFNYFRRMVLPKGMKKQQIDTIRIKLIKVASKVANLSKFQRIYEKYNKTMFFVAYDPTKSEHDAED